MSEEQAKFKVNIVMSGGVKPEETAAWFFYLGRRSMFITQHPEAYVGQSGNVVPTFEEELQGRLMLVESCEQNLKNSKAPTSPYLMDLLRIHKAGYLREHVWWHLGQPTWGANQQPPNLLSFMAWTRVNLRQHNAETHGGIQILRQEARNESAAQGSPTQADRGRTIDVQSSGGAELRAAVTEINAALQRGDGRRAWDLLQNVSSAATQLQKEADAAYVCVQSQRQLNYFLTGRPELRKVRVLDWCVASGTALKAFFLSKSQRFAEALNEVTQPLKLAPFFAQGQIEKGYILNQLRRSQEALAAYALAWDLASRFPENLGFAGAALRGQAVTLVELGDLKRAEKLLHDSLVLDPGNTVAKNELIYIQRRGSGATAPSRVLSFETKPNP
jgi:tetratricopeptide (TPR) repeat protein